MNKIDLLRNYIESQGITVNSLALKMGIKQSTLWRNLNKQSKTDTEKFDKILLTLGIKESDVYAKSAFDKIICIFKDVPITFARTEVVKF